VIATTTDSCLQCSTLPINFFFSHLFAQRMEARVRNTLAQEATHRPQVNAELIQMEREHERKMAAIKKEMV